MKSCRPISAALATAAAITFASLVVHCEGAEPGEASHPSAAGDPHEKAVAADDAWRQLVEADWLKQAEAWRSWRRGGAGQPVTTQSDAAGAVDGTKNGKYAFHTALEPHPWWQVDLGSSQPIARVVVYNRLDYAPGLHNADRLLLLTSDDGNTWTRRHENPGRHFGGVSGAPPLEIQFPPNEVRARFVRLQIPSEQPIYFHLDEVEIYGPAEARQNLALHRPANQSSLSQWSTAKVPVTEEVAAYPTAEWIERGRRLAAAYTPCPASGNGSPGPGQTADVTQVLRDLSELEGRLQQLRDDDPPEVHRNLYCDVRRAVRQLVFLHPLLDFDKLVLVKRFTQETYPDVCLNHMPWVSRPGRRHLHPHARRSRPQPRAPATCSTGPRPGPRPRHGPLVGRRPRGVRLRQGRRATSRPRAGSTAGPTSTCGGPRSRPTSSRSASTARACGNSPRGEWSDLDPTYLPSGDIAFVSERCGYSLQCNEYDKDETSCNLYVMRPDGSNIRRLSVTKDGDYLPHCLDDGTIGYTRWEYQERSWANIQSIWTVRPDGTGADALFKQHLNDPWALEDVRSIPGAAVRQLAAIATGHHTLAAGPVVVITPGDGHERSAGDPHRHARRAAAGRRHVRHAGRRRGRVGQRRLLHDPLAAVGHHVPRVRTRTRTSRPNRPATAST